MRVHRPVDEVARRRDTVEELEQSGGERVRVVEVARAGCAAPRGRSDGRSDVILFGRYIAPRAGSCRTRPTVRERRGDDDQTSSR